MEELELIFRLDVVLAREKMTVAELSQRVNVHVNNLSILKNGHGKAIKYSTLLKICTVLRCTPNDLFEVRPKQSDRVVGLVWDQAAEQGEDTVKKRTLPEDPL